MEYLEERFPEVPLLPKDLAKRAKVSYLYFTYFSIETISHS